MVYVDLATAPEGTMVKTLSGKTYVRSSRGDWYDGKEGWLISVSELNKTAYWVIDQCSTRDYSLVFPDGYMECSMEVWV